MPSTSTCVLLFVKSPRPGTVKTRLGKVIGHERAAQLYTCFGLDIVANLHQCGIEPLVCFAPADAGSAVQAWLGAGLHYRPQQGQDLGERMAEAFTDSFQQGYERTLILGSDSPDLPVTYLQQALAAIAANQITIGPSEDGGYYLLGFTATNYAPDLFVDIPWSTDQVYQSTRQKLQQQPYPVHTLPPWYDVDTLPDLQRLYEHNRTNQPQMRTMVYLNQHQHDIFP